MKRYLALIGIMLALVTPPLCAQGPDETYLVIYNLIQEADALSANDEARQALAKYQQANSMLNGYPTQYPGWNEKVVKFRLSYLTERIQALQAKLPSPGTNTSVTNLTVQAGESTTNQLKALQEEIGRLAKQNALLEAKLKEALSVQPAAVDPRELAKAEAKINQLQKELDLLKASRQPEEPTPAKAPDSAVLDQEKQLLTELKQKLAQQLDQNAALQKENLELKDQITTLKAQPGAVGSATNLTEEAQVARATIAALQTTNIALRTEMILMETRLAEVTRLGHVEVPAKTKELIKERDALKKQLAAANKELSRQKTWAATLKADDTARQLESLLARIDVLEAKAVPFSPEEQALFRRVDSNTSLAMTNSAKKTLRELPPGTGPLIAEAQVALQGGRPADAERLYRQVLVQDDKHVYTLTQLAAVQMDQNRDEEAEATIKKALASEPNDPMCLYLLGRLRYKQNKLDEALEALSLSAKALPNEARTQFLLGQILVQKGQRTAAESAFRKALQLKPAYPDAHHQLALVYATHQPPFKELAQWHYSKAKDKGWPRDPDLEKMLEDNRAGDGVQ